MDINRRAFLQKSLAAGVVAFQGNSAMLHALDRAASPLSLLQARGRAIVADGRPIRLRGVNLGGWMLIEDYMIGLPWTEWKIREQFRKILGDESYSAFFSAFDQSYIAEEDIEFLAHNGFNVVRLPFNYRHFESDLAPGEWLESGFRQMRRVIDLCRKHGIWVMLDLHAAAGAQARDQNAGSAYGETYFWKYRSFMDRTAALWAEIARRYSGDKIIAGYNLLGEPVTSDVAVLNDFYKKTIDAIRKVDREHLIFLDPNLWARDIPSLHPELFSDPQIVVAIHPYFQGDASLTKLANYPAVVDGKTFDRSAVEKIIDQTYEAGRLTCPVMAAEFGAFRSDPQPFGVQLAIVRDQISIFEEKGWSWCMWCYKDLRNMGILTVRPDTPWRRFLDSPEITSFFSSYKKLEAPFTESVANLLSGTDIEADTREQWAREVARDFDVPALDFVLRRLAKHPPSELAEMARSFAFASCEIRQDQLAVLKPFLANS
jgi:hypothetical protein